MRDIKFRGKRIDNGQWVYGYLIKLKVYKPKNQNERCGEVIEVPAYFIQQFSHEDYEIEYRHEVDPETVGQYTGIKDKSGREVYKGDIYFEHDYRKDKKTYWTVDWEEMECSFRIVANIEKQYQGEKYKEKVDLTMRAIEGRKLEYAGNIHDNPELMEVWK